MSKLASAYKKYLQDVSSEKVPADNAAGYRIVRTYRGAYLRWDLTAAGFRALRVKALLCTLLAAVCYPAAVFQPSRTNIEAVSGLIAIACIIPLAYLIAGTIQLFTGGARMPKALFLSRRSKLFNGALFTLIVAAAASAFSLYYCFTTGGVHEWITAAALLLCAFFSLLEVLLFRKRETVEDLGEQASK